MFKFSMFKLRSVVPLAIISMALSGPHMTTIINDQGDVQKVQNTRQRLTTILQTLKSKVADPDEDGMMEPLNNLGEKLPSDVLIQTDEWKTPIKYCAWDLGRPNTMNSLYAQNQNVPKSDLVMRLISAGRNKQFETSCNDVNARGDDIVVEAFHKEVMNVNNPRVDCPPGTNYNFETGKCESSNEVSVNCPFGTNYNPLTGNCEASASVNCPFGTLYNPGTGKCEGSLTTSCPPGTGYNYGTGKCEGNPSISTVRKCTKRFLRKKKCKTYTSINCPSGTSYNSWTGKCEGSASSRCPSGTYYNSWTGRCEASASINCPSGTSYNFLIGKCVNRASVNCPSGTYYNFATKRCEGNFIVKCSSGYGFNFRTRKCERGFMNTNTALNTNTGGFMNTNTALNTNTGGFMNTNTALQSFYDPIIRCPSGTSYNSATGKCERWRRGRLRASYDPTITCPSGTSYNSATRKCVIS